MSAPIRVTLNGAPREFPAALTFGQLVDELALGGRRLAVGGTAYTATLFDAATGKIVWQKNIQKETEADIPDWGFAGSPLVYGKLLILKQLEQFPALLENPETVDRLLKLLHSQIGKMILEAWQFSPEMVTVAAEHENLQRNSGAEVDYTDIVMIANLQSHLGEAGHASFAEWFTIPAYAKLNLTPEQYLAALSDIQQEILEIQKPLTA